MCYCYCPDSSLSTLKLTVSEKKGTCRRLQEQLETLERETAVKLTEMDKYNNDIQVSTHLKHSKGRLLVGSTPEITLNSQQAKALMGYFN